MSATGAGYDLSATTYSPDGRIFQVEYAHKAVELSGAAVGVRCTDGVVLGVEKILQSRTLVKNSNRRIQTVDFNCGLIFAGFAPDARQIVAAAASEASEYQAQYGEKIPGRILADRLASFMHTYTLYYHLRPFGCSVLVATFDDKFGPELALVDPAGETARYFACAVGKHQLAIKTELEKLDFKTVTCREAAKAIGEVIYKNHDDIKDKIWELELSWICDDSNRRHVRVPDDVLAEAVAAGEAASPSQPEPAAAAASAATSS